MGVPESNYLLGLWAKNICPYCGKSIPEGTRVGTGRKSDGGFCSLNCYTRFYQLELQERANRLNQVTTEGRYNEQENSSHEHHDK